MKPSLSIHLVNFAAEPKETQAPPGPDRPGGEGGIPDKWQRMFDLAEAADAAGFGRVAVSDHVAMGERLDRYGDPARGGMAGGRQPTGPDGDWLEPLTVLAAVGARTCNVRLSTAVLIAALRRPVVLAKTAATIDALTGGRLDLGVGVGWQQEEYEAAGVDFATRGQALDHTLEVCEQLWTRTRASHESPGLSFRNIHQAPKPVAGVVPIWVSGTINARAMRRLARFGRGWIPWGADAANLAESIPRMRAAVAAEGGDPEVIEVAGNLAVVRDSQGNPDMAATVAPAGALASAGVTDFRVSLRPPAGTQAATEYLSEWVDAFNAAL